MPLAAPQMDVLSPENEALLRAINGGTAAPEGGDVQMAQLFGMGQPQERPQLSPAERDAIARRRAAAAEMQAAKERAAADRARAEAEAAAAGKLRAGSQAEQDKATRERAERDQPTVSAHPLAYRAGEFLADAGTAAMPFAWRRAAQAGLKGINSNVASKIGEVEALQETGKITDARKLLGGVKSSAKSAKELSNSGVPWYGYPLMGAEAALVPPIISAAPSTWDLGRPGEAGETANKRMSSDVAWPAAGYSAGVGAGALGAGLMADKAIQAMPFSAPGKQRANQAAIDLLVRALKKK